MTSAVIYSSTPITFKLDLQDPFIFTAHHLDYFPRGNADLGPLEGAQAAGPYNMYYSKTGVPGFPAHPHTGFETITIVDSGMVDHFDSLGSCGRYGHVDVQWLSTGHGVQHAEMFPLLSQEHDNPLELFQIWFNSSPAQKQAPAAYKMMWAEKIPHVHHQDSQGKHSDVRIISGQLNGVAAIERPVNSWAHAPEHKVNIFMLTMQAGASITLPATSASSVRFGYFYRGDELLVAGEPVAERYLLELRPDTDIHLQAGQTEARIMWLEGEPIGEPVAMRGPFVLNTEQELDEAFARFRATQFGGWPWEHTAPVFTREQERFASYEHGKVLDSPND